MSRFHPLKPIEGPAAWSGADLSHTDEWIYSLSPTEADEIERGSRAALGGLPSAEYLLHIVSSFGMGLAVASYAFASTSALDLTGMLGWQVRGMVAVGLVLLFVEGALFVRALASRWRIAGPLPA